MLTLCFAGCGADTERVDAVQPDGDGIVETVVIVSLTPGDRACYVEFEAASGSRRDDEAAFDLCERPELVGRRVRLTRERAAILAASCEGDPDCARRDTVNLIVAAEVLP